MGVGTRLVGALARAVAHTFYRVDVVGDVPAGGPLLLLPNHPNALLDPALIIATAGRPVRFLAKSTLFSGPFAPLLRASHAIPVYRRQDSADTGKNEETFTAVHRALADGHAVCIFPEGISHSSGRLEPLRTGAARMTLAARAAGVPIRLLPVGVNLEAKTTFRSRALIAYGAAFTPSATGVRELTEEIADHLRQVMIEADPAADAALVHRIDRLYRSERPGQRDAHAALLRRRTIAEGLRRLRAARPEWYEAALVQLRRYDDRMRRFGLHDAALDWTVSARAARTFAAREIPAAVVFVPVAAAAVLMFIVPYLVTAAAARLSRDMDVTATVKAVGGLLIYGLWTMGVAAAAVVLGGPLAAAAAVAGMPLLAVGGLLALERETAAWKTARAWFSLRGARPMTRAALKRRRGELASVLEEMNQWLGN
jgi:glycerol-3-phosphate O-acyltransferase/dihydroxyacetone phosphate acyltransferase